MKKIVIFSLVLLFLFSLSYYLFIQKPTVTIDHHQFVVEIAQTSKDQERGLAKYNFLPQNKGMYFSFTHPDMYRFWMKNMQFPIDIIFIRNSRIIAIFPNVPAPEKGQLFLPTYGPSSPADAVVELNAGIATQYGFKKGDAVQLTQ